MGIIKVNDRVKVKSKYFTLHNDLEATVVKLLPENNEAVLRFEYIDALQSYSLKDLKLIVEKI